ncbi:MAG: hypothetical protein HQK51_19510 [Oligoflexia bacterium]|nr:hypothetical protein [Oligoflexia bacterium]
MKKITLKLFPLKQLSFLLISLLVLSSVMISCAVKTKNESNFTSNSDKRKIQITSEIEKNIHQLFETTKFLNNATEILFKEIQINNDPNNQKIDFSVSLTSIADNDIFRQIENHLLDFYTDLFINFSLGDFKYDQTNSNFEYIFKLKEIPIEYSFINVINNNRPLEILIKIQGVYDENHNFMQSEEEDKNKVNSYNELSKSAIKQMQIKIVINEKEFNIANFNYNFFNPTSNSSTTETKINYLNLLIIVFSNFGKNQEWIKYLNDNNNNNSNNDNDNYAFTLINTSSSSYLELPRPNIKRGLLACKEIRNSIVKSISICDMSAYNNIQTIERDSTEFEINAKLKIRNKIYLEKSNVSKIEGEMEYTILFPENNFFLKITNKGIFKMRYKSPPINEGNIAVNPSKLFNFIFSGEHGLEEVLKLLKNEGEGIESRQIYKF